MTVKPPRHGAPPDDAGMHQEEEDTSTSIQGRTAERGRQVRHVLTVVLVLNLAVAGAKIGYGYLSGSVAMTADGFQSLLDGVANVVGIAGIVAAARPPDQEHHFGHGRYETLASMAIGALMTIGVVGIAQAAISRWLAGESPEVTRLSFGIMLGTMVINICVTIWERRAARRLRSDLLAADARHTGSDVLVSGAVILGLAGERLGLQGADAAVSLAVAGVIAWTAWGILREASLVLTDAATDVDPRALLAAIVAAPGVITAHNLRVRSSGGQNWAEVHITVEPDMTVRAAHDVATGVEIAIRDEVGPETQAIVHVEPAVPPHTRPDPIFGEDHGVDAALGRNAPRRQEKGNQ